MTWFRRIAFFLGLNIVVMLTLSLVTRLLGIEPYLTGSGLNIGSLMAFCLVWGMGGAFISLALSKVMAKWTMGVKIIDPQTNDPHLRELVQSVHQMARQAGLQKMPEVGIYESPEVNAFATGPTKNNSLVAVSTGLLHTMDKRAVDGVLGHEVAHVANGDMVTMTLIQGVVNAFVMALARIIAFAIDNLLRSRDDNGGGLGQFGYMIAVFVLEMILFIPGSMVVAYFSRLREYRADAGGARIAGRDNMIAALRSLQRVTAINMSPEAQGAPSYASMKISKTKGGLFELMSTHPALEDRIARLERGY
jgi:heat shock protein HtpX